MARTQTVAEQLIDRAGDAKDASRLTHTETVYSVVNVEDNSTTVYSGPCLLFGVYVNEDLSAHALPIKDNSTTVVTLPASWGAGNFAHFPGIRFETSLVVDPDDSGDGSIVVAYRPI